MPPPVAVAAPAAAVAVESAWRPPSAGALQKVVRFLVEAAVAVAWGVGSEEGLVEGPARWGPCAVAADPAASILTH